MTDLDRIHPLTLGNALPQVSVRSNYDDNSALGNVAGRYALFCIFGRASHPASHEALLELGRQAALHDNADRVIVAVSSSPQDESHPLVQ
jgi:hypothetical protein